MRNRNHHIILILLLVTYTLLGVVGHLETLTIFGFGTDPHNLLAAKSGPPPTAKVYWTQHKHIPATVKISVPSPAIVVQPEVSHRLHIHGVVFASGAVLRYWCPIISTHSPRAPPQA